MFIVELNELFLKAMNKKLLLILIVLFVAYIAKSEVNYDSLETNARLLKSKGLYNEYLADLTELARNYGTTNPKKAFEFVKDGIKYAIQLDNKVKLSDFYRLLGTTLRHQGLYYDALDAMIKSQDIISELLREGTIDIPKNDIAWTMLDVGNIYYDLYLWELAKEQYSKAEKIFKELKDNWGLSVVQNNYGLILLETKKPKEALNHFMNAYIIRKSQSKDAIAHSYLTIAQAYRDMKDTLALKYYDNAIKLYKEIADSFSIFKCYWDKGLYYYLVKNEKKLADSFFHIALDGFNRINTTVMVPRILTHLSTIYKANGDIEKAIEYSLEAYQFSKKENLFKEVEISANSLSWLYEQKQDFSNALKYQKEISQIRDSTFTNDFAIRISNLNIKIETENLLKSKKELEEKAKYQNILLFLIISFSVILMVIFIIRYRAKNKLNADLVEKNKRISEQSEEIAKQKNVLETLLVDLQSSETKFRNLVENASDGIVILKNGIIKYTNPQFEIITGFNKEYLLEKNFISFCNDNSEISNQLFSQDEKQTKKIIDVEFINSNNSVVYLQLNIANSIFEGEPAYILIMRDMSEYKKAQDEILKLKEAVAQSASQIVITDLNEVIEYANNKFLENTGYTIGEVLGNTPRAIQSGLTPYQTYIDLKHCMNNDKEWRGDFINLKKDGTIFWERATIFPIFNSKGIKTNYAKVSEDVTILKFNENALKESEERLRIITENSSDLIVITDKNGIIANELAGTYNLLKYEHNYLKGKSIFDFIHNDDVIHTKNTFDSVVHTEKGSAKSEFRIRHKNGEYKDVVCSLVNMLDNSAIKGIVTTINDISERKQAEILLKNSESHLRELNVSKDKFFSIISHDLKNPFNFILMETKRLISDFDEIPDIKNNIVELHQSSQQIYNLLENLLSWGRSQTNRLSFKPIEFDLYELAYNSIYINKVNSDSKNISIVSEVKEDTIITADYNMLNTMLRNLISNAVKFTQIGGNIKISYLQNNGNNIIRVSDSGIGMDEKMISKLFKIDENISTLGTAGESGTGLGLILCSEFAKKHNGSIEVSSELGKGTTFSIILPLIKKSS